MQIERHSPSSLNLFAASPAMFVLERILGHKQPVGSPAHRGVAVEEGVAQGLLHPEMALDDCIEAALVKYDTISALSPDARRGQYRGDIPGMVRHTLGELKPYGIPTATQGFVEWKPEGLKYPIVGYWDFHWEEHNITVDLKTSEKMPSKIKYGHARQISLYVTSNNADARVTYCSPKKCYTYSVENIDEHRKALHQIALRVERFLSLSNDPDFFTSITMPDLESFYWGSPTARQLAFEMWGV